MRKQFAILFMSLLGFAAMTGLLTHLIFVPAQRQHVSFGDAPSGWFEVAWPFQRDQFPPGLAFECRTESCAYYLRLTFRAKVGFCDCTRGVADDEDLDRMGDIDFLGANAAPAGPGTQITLAGMQGRTRLYLIRGRDGLNVPALSFVVSKTCDVVVATASGANLAGSQAAAQAFLNDEAMRLWIERVLN
jgi:hypothetical protein